MKKIIISSIAVAFLLTSCTEEKTDTKVKNESVVKTEQSSKTNVDIIKEKSSEIVNSSKELAKAIGAETKEIVSNSGEITKDVVEKASVVTKEVVSKAQDVTKEVTKTIENVMKTKKESTTSVDSLYLKCTGCHGQNSEKKALGKSAIIKDWDANKIEEALLGYKAGTYGSTMKGVMMGQVMSLSNEDIKILSEHISNL